MSRELDYVDSSDWHLAPGAWKSMPGIRGDSYYALAQIVYLFL